METPIKILIILTLLLSGCETLPVSHAPVFDNETVASTDQCSGTREDRISPTSFLAVDLIKEIQARLILLGYTTGQIDGIYGKKTQQGIRTYQAENHLLIDGRPTPELLEHIINTQRTSGVDLSGITQQVARQTVE